MILWNKVKVSDKELLDEFYFHIHLSKTKNLILSKVISLFSTDFFYLQNLELTK